MADLNLDQLADSWIEQYNLRTQSDKTAGLPSDAIDRVSDLDLEGNHATLWTFILAAYPKEMPVRVKAVFAAGPIEDLLAHFGPEYIDRVEALARRDPKFNDFLGGVWQNAMTDEVWERVIGVRNNVW